MTTDFTFANHGSICLLSPVSKAATIWVEEHLPDDRLEYAGAVVIEPRYAQPILEGLTADGYTVGEQ